MQELTIQDFRTIITKLADMFDKGDYEYSTPFTVDGIGYTLGFKSYLGDVLFRDGVVIFSEDCNELWLQFYGEEWDSLDDIAHSIWVNATGT